MISAMRSRWKTIRILIGNTDLDAAYRWIHTDATTTSTCIAIVDKLYFLCSRLPFGTTPTPEEYTTVSEAATDLGNDILQDESWDTDYLNSSHRSLILLEPRRDRKRFKNSHS